MPYDICGIGIEKNRSTLTPSSGQTVRLSVTCSVSRDNPIH